MKQVLILGATSAIAQATARRLAASGAGLFLVARDPARLDILADDLRVRGAGDVSVLTANLLDQHGHAAILAAAWDAMPALDTVLIAHGVLPDQAECQGSAEATLAALDSNFLSVVSLLTLLAGEFEHRGSGVLAVISSVAGDRGRQSNYVYGAAKGGLSLFLQGLRNRLHKSGVHVLTVKPGFVKTPMTAHLEGREGPLWATPDTIAAGILRAIEKRRDVVYLPGFWRFIMWVICSIPERLFKRLSL